MIKLTDEQKAQLERETEITSRVCPLCHTMAWHTAGVVVELPPFLYGESLTGEAHDHAYPVVPVRCGNCDHVILFSAQSLGFV